jgi:predicted PurR-regulated permease PerM
MESGKNNDEDSQVEPTAAGVDRLLLLQRQLSVLVLALLAIFLFFQVGSYFADIFRILGYSILLFYIFINSVDWLEKYLPNRAMAILIVYLGLLALTIFGVIVVVPALLYQVSQLVSSTFNQFPQIIQQSIKTLAPVEASLHAASIRIKAVDILTNIATSLPKPDPGMVFGRVTDVAMSTMTWLIYGLSTVVVSFYFLLDGRNMKELVINLFPKRYYLMLTIMTTDVDLSLQMFFRGQIVLGLLFGLFMIAVFLCMGVHYALLLGAFLGVCEIIPVIGPAIGFIPIVLTVAFDGMDNIVTNRFAQVVIIFMVLNLVQWLKDNIVAPRYIGNVIGLHPVMIFIAIMIGARLDGLSGIICSLPVACVVNVLVSHISSRFGPSRSPLQESVEGSSVEGSVEGPDVYGPELAKPKSAVAAMPEGILPAKPDGNWQEGSGLQMAPEEAKPDIVDQIKERAHVRD